MRLALLVSLGVVISSLQEGIGEGMFKLVVTNVGLEFHFNVTIAIYIAIYGGYTSWLEVEISFLVVLHILVTKTIFMMFPICGVYVVIKSEESL